VKKHKVKLKPFLIKQQISDVESSESSSGEVELNQTQGNRALREAPRRRGSGRGSESSESSEGSEGPGNRSKVSEGQGSFLGGLGPGSRQSSKAVGQQSQGSEGDENERSKLSKGSKEGDKTLSKTNQSGNMASLDQLDASNSISFQPDVSYGIESLQMQIQRREPLGLNAEEAPSREKKSKGKMKLEVYDSKDFE
jgi:hypothetical protein